MSSLADTIRPGRGRGLDFVILSELRKRTSITQDNIVKWSMSEMLANSLDTDATEIWIEVREKGSFNEITVSDNGTTKIALQAIETILDFSGKASSKRGFFMVSRGYLGNALKCIFGYSYALADDMKLPPPDIVVTSHGTRFRIQLTPDKIEEVINSEIIEEDVESNVNSFSIEFPISIQQDMPSELVRLREIIFATSMVNPTRKITYNMWGYKEEFGESLASFVPRRETSVKWYEKDQFTSLFKDFVRATPDTLLTDFVAMFRGFTGRAKKKEILANLASQNRESGADVFCEFLPKTRIRELGDEDIGRLYREMLAMSSEINVRSIHKVLGLVGKDQFEKVRERKGWSKLKYVLERGRTSNWRDVAYPFIFEIAVFERAEDDEGGVRVYQCVNFMASMEDIFSRLYDLRSHLARCGVKNDQPVTLVAHFICPVLKWLDYGKAGLYE